MERIEHDVGGWGWFGTILWRVGERARGTASIAWRRARSKATVHAWHYGSATLLLMKRNVCIGESISG